MGIKVNAKKIEEYRVLKDAFTVLKAQEAKMRVEILEALFSSDGTGTFNTAVGDYNVKGIFKNNYKLDVDLTNENWDEMSQAERDCIVYKPNLIMKEYNKLEDDEAPMLDDYITVSPAMPSMEIKEIPDDA